jgi:hypothetical protein
MCYGGFSITFTLIEKRLMPNDMGCENVPRIRGTKGEARRGEEKELD